MVFKGIPPVCGDDGIIAKGETVHNVPTIKVLLNFLHEKIKGKGQQSGVLILRTIAGHEKEQ